MAIDPNLNKLEWVKYIADPTWSIEERVLGDAALVCGMPYGVITASGKAVPWDPGNADGSETLAGVWYSPTAVAVDKKGAGLKRGDAFVDHDKLTWKTGLTAGNITTGKAALVALRIEHKSTIAGGLNV